MSSLPIPRILLSLAIAFQPLASATERPRIYNPVFQRRAMARAIAPFALSLDRAERRRIFDANLAAGRFQTYGEKREALDEIALEVANLTGEFLRHSRAGRIPEAREKLRVALTEIVRAAGLNLVFTDFETEMAGLFTILGWLGVTIGAVMVGAVTYVGIGPSAPRGLVEYPAMVCVGSVGAAIFATAFSCNLPGSTKLAHAIGKPNFMDGFWRSVGEWLKTDPLLADVNLKTPAQFRDLLEAELGGVPLDQARAGALSVAPPEKSSEPAQLPCSA